MLPPFSYLLIRLWRQAIQYADLVTQFAVSLTVSIVAAFYLGDWLGLEWIWLPVIFVMAPMCFFRLYVQLEKINGSK